MKIYGIKKMKQIIVKKYIFKIKMDKSSKIHFNNSNNTNNNRMEYKNKTKNLVKILVRYIIIAIEFSHLFIYIFFYIESIIEKVNVKSSNINNIVSDLKLEMNKAMS